MKKFVLSAVFAVAVAGLFAQSTTASKPAVANKSTAVAAKPATTQTTAPATHHMDAKTAQQPTGTAKPADKPKAEKAAKASTTGTTASTTNKTHKRRHHKKAGATGTTGAKPTTTPTSAKPAGKN